MRRAEERREKEGGEGRGGGEEGGEGRKGEGRGGGRGSREGRRGEERRGGRESVHVSALCSLGLLVGEVHDAHH